MIEVIGTALAFVLTVMLFGVLFTALCFCFRCLRYVMSLWGSFLVKQQQPPRQRRYFDD